MAISLSSAAPKLRCGIIGTGRAAQARLRAFQQPQQAALAKLAAVASYSPERAAAFASQAGCPALSPAALLADPQLDAVLICTHNQHHAELAEAALQAGKHVLVEYPLALSAVAGERLFALSQKHQRVLQVEQIDLLSPWFLALQAALPRIGGLLYLSWQDERARQPQPGDWTFDMQAGSTFFQHMAVPSRLLALAGPATVVACLERHEGWEGTRYQRRVTHALLRFAGGASGTIVDATGLAVPGGAFALTAVGTQGRLDVQNKAKLTLTTAEGREELPIPEGPGLFAEDLRQFLTAITEGQPTYVTPAHTLAAMHLAEALQQAARQGLTAPPDSR